MRNFLRTAAVRAVLVLATAPLLLTLGGCATDAQTGALIGAGAGAAGGYIIGNEMDKQDDHHHHHR
jgi:hypothetical protein